MGEHRHSCQDDRGGRVTQVPAVKEDEGRTYPWIQLDGFISVQPAPQPTPESPLMHLAGDPS